jgi:phosphate starvation-inducible PhoH-like protein
MRKLVGFSKKTRTLVVPNVPKKEIVFSTKQALYYDYLRSPDLDMVISVGPAGTGKTLIACKAALKSLHANEISKIILTRPTVTVEGEDIGFLPGGIEDKFQPFSQPLFDCFQKESCKYDIENLIKKGKIEVCPLGFLRGRTFDNAFIIADEMQNSVTSQTKMLLTRVGKNSKLVVTGDNTQCDLDDKMETNGLQHLLERLANMYPTMTDLVQDNMAIVMFTEDDCNRSKFVRKILKIYN